LPGCGELGEAFEAGAVLIVQHRHQALRDERGEHGNAQLATHGGTLLAVAFTAHNDQRSLRSESAAQADTDVIPPTARTTSYLCSPSAKFSRV
jgi:hypothetical protein